MANVQFRDNLSADKRNNRGRFSWVRRLVQGQNRQGIDGLGGEHHPSHRGEVNATCSASVVVIAAENEGLDEDSESGEKNEEASNFDNASTTPLKSVLSFQSTQPASILSDGSHDQTSVVASTAETSLAPSVFTSTTQIPHSAASQIQERDSESIVTLASSSRRIRRRSLDTNSSMTGIPPASIVEKFTVHPAAASMYAVSVKTVDRGEPHEPETASDNSQKKEDEEENTEEKDEQVEVSNETEKTEDNSESKVAA